MGWIFFVVAAILFFFAAVGVAIIPNPAAWGLFFLSVGLVVGNWQPTNWKR